MSWLTCAGRRAPNRLAPTARHTPLFHHHAPRAHSLCSLPSLPLLSSQIDEADAALAAYDGDADALTERM